MMKYKSGWRGVFLNELKKGRPVTVACNLVGVGRERVSQERRKDPEFAEQMDNIRQARPYKGKGVSW